MSDLELPPMWRLSEELIAIIVDFVLHHPSNTGPHDTSDVRSLRLAHPRFAQSSSIQRALFRKVCLSARYPRRDVRAFTSIAGSVKTVVFETMQLVPATGPQENPLRAGYWGRQTRIWTAAKEYVDSGRAESDWIEVLRSISILDTVVVSAPQRQVVRRRAKLEMAEAVPNDWLLSVALNCLSTANIKPRKMVLHDEDGVSYIGWRNVQDWGIVDLSQVENLDLVSWFDTTHLLSRSASSLKTLRISANSPWPTSDWHVSLNALQDLSLYDMSITPWTLIPFLQQCSYLRWLSLNDTPLQGRRFLRDWRPIFDAIRTHPSRMHVFIKGCLFVVEEGALTIDHHTSQAPVEKHHKTVDDRVAYEIERYISNAGDWDLKEFEGLL
ncbi:hypothetical protein DOTSEDRAFT_83067 [Dothistroma septosporum NZE10]|uniref:F-box domain-containing protein n=1 Tax=Dothistroma septosporum (strain NZE10 / CBS 128990) TaxID=675120 RepID=M2YK32_DOTSN|nr:hypothetical protein DOTSEDRAFT_83067 [Dothistroma septosporum NZE10]